MRKINLFVDAHVFDNEFQGSRTFIKEIYTLICQKPGIQLFIAAYYIEQLRENFANCENIVFIKYRHKSAISRLLFEIPAIIKNHNIDYAHFQYIVAPLKKCKYITTIHDVVFKDYPNQFPLFYRIKKTFLFKCSVIQSDIITTVSAYSKNAIIKHLKPGSKTIYLTANGVNAAFFKPYEKVQSQRLIKDKYSIGKYILYVSRFEPRKNHLLLLNTYLELKLYEEGYYLVLLGHVSIEVNEFKFTLEKLPQEIRRFIIIHHKINDQALMEFYRGAHLFAYPSKAEGFGIPPLEAGALKVPVICSNTSAMKDYTFFGEYQVDAGNPQTFKEKMKTILMRPPSAEELEKISYQIHERYSWDKPADILYEAISNNC